MTQCRRVAQDVWLALVTRAPEGVAIERERRWASDREAADRAVAAVLEAWGLAREACATSRSHTCGLAAAVAAPAGVAVGVDLVEVARVSRRHADAILSAEEWEALEPYAAARPALGWALKEAAAKACGDPSSRFPLGLRIIADTGGLTVEALGPGRACFTAGWGLFDDFLYAWVQGNGRASANSRIDWNRSTGDLASARLTTTSTAGGTCRFARAAEAVEPRRIRRTMSEMDDPVYGGVPVSIS
jgi:hypothetical protein